MTIGDLTNRGEWTAKFASYAPPSNLIEKEPSINGHWSILKVFGTIVYD